MDGTVGSHQVANSVSVAIRCFIAQGNCGRYRLHSTVFIIVKEMIILSFDWVKEDMCTDCFCPFKKLRLLTKNELPSFEISAHSV